MEIIVEHNTHNYSDQVMRYLEIGMSLIDAYLALLSSYIRVGVPDKALLSEYVMRAKGPERSLRQFADDIGVNVSTLSRIINQKISGTNSDILFAKIAANADKNCGVTFEMFMEALGMAKDVNEINDKAIANIRSTVKETIINELLKRDYEVKLLKNESVATLGGKFSFDLSLETNAWGSYGQWGFVIETDYATTEKQTDEEFEKTVKRLMRKISYFSSLYETYGFYYDKVTLVLVDEDLFYYIQSEYEKMRDLYLKHEISLILIDKETELLKQEYIIQWIRPDGEDERKEVFTVVSDDEQEVEELHNAWRKEYDD